MWNAPISIAMTANARNTPSTISIYPPKEVVAKRFPTTVKMLAEKSDGRVIVVEAIFLTYF